jgi:hypothetical protein
MGQPVSGRVPRWGGRRAQLLVQATLTSKGRTCHLCQLPGANSADHDPPRSELIRAGIADPDALRFLFPAHLLCNVLRKARPITDDLRAELRARLLESRRVGTPAVSARFAQRLREAATP